MKTNKNYAINAVLERYNGLSREVLELLVNGGNEYIIKINTDSIYITTIFYDDDCFQTRIDLPTNTHTTYVYASGKCAKEVK